MKKITVLHLESCPYCQNAKRAVKELTAASTEYAKIEVEWIEESLHPELAQPFAKDYYYVPSIFIAGKKGLRGASR